MNESPSLEMEDQSEKRPTPERVVALARLLRERSKQMTPRATKKMYLAEMYKDAALSVIGDAQSIVCDARAALGRIFAASWDEVVAHADTLT